MAWYMKRLARCAATGLVALSALAMLGLAPQPLTPFAGLAHADDDDDGDDDGGGFGGDGQRGERQDQSNRRYAPPRFFRDLRRQVTRERDRRRPQRRQQAAPEPAFSGDEIIALGMSSDQVDALVARGYEVRSRQALAALGGEVLKLVPPSGVRLDAAREAVLQISPAASVDFNHIYSPSEADRCGGRPCVAPSLVGWPAAMASGAACSARDVTVGLIDTSINAEHETFRESRIEVYRLDPNDDGRTGQQHGTAVASLLIGTGPAGTPGLLPGARLIAIDAFKANDRADAFDLIRSIDMLAGKNVGVINMSLSGPDNALLKRAVEVTAQTGVGLIAAAGNDGPGGKPAFPAAYDQVVAVTAVDRGKRAYRRANRGDYIDLAAPGVGVWTAASIKGTRPKTGTSFAAPFVTAAAALALAQGHEPAEIPDLLKAGAEDLGEPGKDPVYGWGLLDASTLCRPR